MLSFIHVVVDEVLRTASGATTEGPRLNLCNSDSKGKSTASRALADFGTTHGGVGVTILTGGPGLFYQATELLQCSRDLKPTMNGPGVNWLKLRECDPNLQGSQSRSGLYSSLCDRVLTSSSCLAPAAT